MKSPETTPVNAHHQPEEALFPKNYDIESATLKERFFDMAKKCGDLIMGRSVEVEYIVEVLSVEQSQELSNKIAIDSIDLMVVKRTDGSFESDWQPSELVKTVDHHGNEVDGVTVVKEYVEDGVPQVASKIIPIKRLAEMQQEAIADSLGLDNLSEMKVQRTDKTVEQDWKIDRIVKSRDEKGELVKSVVVAKNVEIDGKPQLATKTIPLESLKAMQYEISPEPRVAEELKSRENFIAYVKAENEKLRGSSYGRIASSTRSRNNEIAAKMRELDDASEVMALNDDIKENQVKAVSQISELIRGGGEEAETAIREYAAKYGLEADLVIGNSNLLAECSEYIFNKHQALFDRVARLERDIIEQNNPTYFGEKARVALKNIIGDLSQANIEPFEGFIRPSSFPSAGEGFTLHTAELEPHDEIMIPIGMFVSAEGFDSWMGRGENGQAFADGKPSKDKIEAYSRMSAEDKGAGISDISIVVTPSNKVLIKSNNAHRVAAARKRGDSFVRFDGSANVTYIDYELV